MPAPGSHATRARLASALASVVLVGLALAYYFTCEPAFEISVTWREGTTWLRRLQLERQHGLVRGRDIADWTVWYDLVDVRPENIGGLKRAAEVAAVHGVDPETDLVPPDAPYGDGWMWIGSRLPVLRHRGVTPAIIGACAAVLALSLPAALGWPFRVPRQRLQVTAAVALSALAAAWYSTYEPAPGVSVRWRREVTESERQVLERTFRLARARAPEGRTIIYDLLDARSSNVRALVEHPQVDDTGYIDRDSFNVPANAPFGSGGTWIGNRIPVLRTYGVIPALIAACLLQLLYPAARAVTRRRKSVAV